MRFLPRGGIWKNTEDEILKAAVMKYGLNQWSRISSLLTRKSAKQCKSRWYEWLDPSIKKTEWTREEEEKLLHLAKIIPTQWRTIAPIIGRTASQCLEHYEKIISMHDSYDQKEKEIDPKRLRPGEIDPAPETKPARPDPIDMDEDELEMLQEARARLANTKGKKAKRKAREKMLQEARRLATLQKKRELKAAGIKLIVEEKKSKIVEMNYNLEIPLYQKQPIGFFDTTKEDMLAEQNKKPLNFKNLTSETFEGKQRDVIEEIERKKDIKRQRLFREENLPEAIKKISSLNDPKMFTSKRPELKLPEPQVSENELQDIAKLHNEEFSTVDNDISSHLISKYSASSTPILRTRTPIAENLIQKDIEDNITLMNRGNPLLHSETVKLHNPDFNKSGMTPVNTPVVTPNALKMSLTPHSEVNSTPGKSFSTPNISTPGDNSQTPTPFRDKFNINTPISNYSSDGSSSIRSNKRQKTMFKRKIKKLKEQFKNLPKPKLLNSLYNNKKIIMPNLNILEDNNLKHNQEIEEDQADIDKRISLKKIEEENENKSRVIKKGLPRPLYVNSDFIGKSDKFKDIHPLHRNASDSIREELIKMIKYDNCKFPIEGLKKTPKIQKMDKIESCYFDQAKNLLNEEIKEMSKKQNMENFLNIWKEVDESIQYIPANQSFGFISNYRKSKQLKAIKQEFELLHSHIDVKRKKAEKFVKRIDTLTKGYKEKIKNLEKEIDSIENEVSEKKEQLNAFNNIYQREHCAIPIRQERLKNEVENELKKEKTLQKQYQVYFEEYQKLEESIDK